MIIQDAYKLEAKDNNYSRNKKLNEEIRISETIHKQ